MCSGKHMQEKEHVIFFFPLHNSCVALEKPIKWKVSEI